MREEPDRPLVETLTAALRPRRVLLILDTCEHVVDGSAALVQQLLAGCPGLRVIATSREPLRVRGETVWRVPPLELPLAAGELSAAELEKHEAIRLFTDRAAAVRPGFALDADNSRAVVRLCRTLDGMPLAIELAAARVGALSVEQIAARLGDRFQLLASGDRTAPVRQQTLRAAVDWSYELLTEPEQLLLRRLAVFAGWNLDMAEQVCADEAIPAEQVLDLLAALIDKSLVTLDGELEGDARYRLLDTIREYATGRLRRVRRRARDTAAAPRLHAAADGRHRRRRVRARRPAVAGARGPVPQGPGRARQLPRRAGHLRLQRARPNRGCACAPGCAACGWPTATPPRAWAGSTGSSPQKATAKCPRASGPGP